MVLDPSIYHVRMSRICAGGIQKLQLGVKLVVKEEEMS
jgi:hypothetical protein